MAKIINLRTARKQAARAKARRDGDEMAARSGRNKAQREQEAADAAKARAHLDAHERTRET